MHQHLPKPDRTPWRCRQKVHTKHRNKLINSITTQQTLISAPRSPWRPSNLCWSRSVCSTTVHIWTYGSTHAVFHSLVRQLCVWPAGLVWCWRGPRYWSLWTGIAHQWVRRDYSGRSVKLITRYVYWCVTPLPPNSLHDVQHKSSTGTDCF